MRFDFSTAGQILFGAGRRAEIAPLAKSWGKRVLLVTGANPQRATPIEQALREAGLSVDVFACAGEPSVSTVVHAVHVARAAGTDVVIGFGGGSAVDAAKAVAGFLTNDGEPLDYLEVVGKGQPLTRQAAPWIAVPTTAGTGAEVTRNAVLSVTEEGVKVSLRSPHLLARAAVVDPELTLDLPADVTAYTAMDALTQLIEAYVCLRANPMTDALCSAALPRAASAIPAVRDTPGSLPDRTDLAFASLSSGLALANAGLGAVHGFASPIGGRYNAPHGAICAALLAPIMGANVRALQARSPKSPALERYRHVAIWLTGKKKASPEDGVAWVQALVGELPIPKLSRLGVSSGATAELVARAQRASSTQGNPIVLTADELSAALTEAL
ncbi:alcohol dehydrogenase [Opitutaceae bacterium EW11]|nr:alcohol dehydrogenase [Opitutaceae bacterium EW11]